MLRVAKTTTGSQWGDPIAAEVGDRVAFLFYFHNGVPNTEAHDTTLRVDLPTFETNQIKAISWLWSRETQPIKDTVVNGQIIGNSGATINLPTNGRIEYVPGSTKLFTYDTGSQVVRALPDGIANEGVNIGDIQGCWPYSGYVTFLADIMGKANVVIDKHVAKPHNEDWQESVNAVPGEEVVYKLALRNEGNLTAKNVTVIDRLPTNTALVSGSVKLWNNANPNGVTVPDTIGTTGISIPDMAPAGPGVTYVTYKVKISPNLTQNWVLVNVAAVYLNGVEQDRDDAKVYVQVNIGLLIDKKIVTSTGVVETTTVKMLDKITYQIVVKNTGNVPVNNVYVRDVLPQFVSYVPGSTTVDGVKASDQIISESGLLIGTIAAGGQGVIRLEGFVYGCPPAGNYQLLNTAYARADGVTQISDTALATVDASAPPIPKVIN
ncbi:MAG: hypothetical protein BWY68_00245 [bacterium ADurb.Bin400]|nr:MAG: hypothetical protein BWY68_00245 [bacterium ADurb.Bin400]